MARKWKPSKPIVQFDRTLSDREAWWREFSDEFRERCNGEVDGEWLMGLAGTLYPLNMDRPPRQAAEVAFVTMRYELLVIEQEEPITLSAPQSPPALH